MKVPGSLVGKTFSSRVNADQIRKLRRESSSSPSLRLPVSSATLAELHSFLPRRLPLIVTMFRAVELTLSADSSAGVEASISDHRRLWCKLRPSNMHSAVPSNRHTLARHRKKRTKDRIYLYPYFTPYWIQQSYQYMEHDSKVHKNNTSFTPNSAEVSAPRQMHKRERVYSLLQSIPETWLPVQSIV
jgi:hypothetical protein